MVVGCYSCQRKEPFDRLRAFRIPSLPKEGVDFPRPGRVQPYSMRKTRFPKTLEVFGFPAERTDVLQRIPQKWTYKSCM